MKTMKNILLFFGVVSLLSFMSCETPIAFGERLDVDGPVLTIISPKPRKAVTDEFTIEGTVSDATGVAKLLIKISKNNEEKAKMWLYEGGTWKVSEDSGASWTPYEDGTWSGSDKYAAWSIDIVMSIDGVPLGDGEYMFIFQAWDKGGFSDDNSFRTLTLIIDSDPPKVEISNPFLYKLFDDPEMIPNLRALHNKEGYQWQDPAMIGKFQTQAFMLQWQIEDDHDLWAFDIRFYPDDTIIDNVADTPLPEGYFYSYYQNEIPVPVDPDPLNYIRPNGSVMVPALDSAPGNYGGGIISRSVTEKTTIKVVAVCYDAAGNANQEKTLGYFIYWPEADYPWITYTQGMEPLSKYTNDPKVEALQETTEKQNKINELIKENALTIYPGRPIRANAFHYIGLKEVSYTLWLYGEDGSLTEVPGFSNITISNPPRNGAYSTTFQWDFEPLARSATYIIRAVPKSLDDKVPQAYDIYEAVFRVQDITFPEFVNPPEPSASLPLFMNLNPAGTAFTINGTVSDATEITSVCLVWINPESAEYGSMAQLEYFRDQGYAGWVQAETLTAGGAFADEDKNYKVTAGQDYPYDENNPNRLWKIQLSNRREDPATRRILYDYSRTINLSDLKIGMNNGQPLRSQVFLLKASNPDGKTTIITYAPQGDTNLPTIGIDKVEILLGDDVVDSFIPRGKPGWTADEGFKLVPQFKSNNDKIRIHGSWIEDSAEYLSPATYFYPSMEFSISGTTITSATGTITHTLGPQGAGSPGTSRTGTFTVTATVGQGAGYAIPRAAVLDSLVVNVKAKDFGGNSAEDGASWLVESDELKFLRVSSDMSDQAYARGTIAIFLEFNKPVRLKTGVTNPVLILNTGGTATYRSGQTIESTKQYFDYTIQSGHNTPALNVTGLNPNDNGYNNNDYRFSWVHTASGQTSEIHLVSQDRGTPTGSWTFNILQTSGIQSLSSNKSLEIDTTPPTIDSITGTRGWHRVGAEIYINVKFSEAVAIGTPTPYLVLNTGNATETNRRTSTAANDIRVNNDTITFVYRVIAGDNTPTSELQIEQANNQISIYGTITDVPGTAFVRTNVTAPNRTISGAYIDTTVPPIPTVTVLNTSNAIINSDVNTTTVNANSNGQGQIAWNPGAIPPGDPAPINNLQNVYLNELRLNVNGNSTDTNRDSYRIEYSTNYGTSWSEYTGVVNWGSTAPNGAYQIIARQIDRAGNVSNWSRPIVFNWDKGVLFTSINSTSPNGTYTYNTQRQDSIPITVYFRKPLRFSAAPSIRLNTNNGEERTTNILATTGTIGTTTQTFANGTAYDSLTFTYDVADGHSTGASATSYLRVTNFILNGNVRDNERVSVTDLFSLPPAASIMPGKQIRVLTDALTVTTAAALGNETAVSTDNTLNTTLTVTFSHAVSRGSNNSEITITQTAASYRLPAVLTEAERNRFRSLAGEALFDEFYTQGTNGVTSAATGTVDTSVKYILNYNQVPTSITPNASGTNIQRLAEAFRQAEKLTFNATSSAVTFANNGGANRQLRVALNGTNALRVPGGTYDVIIPAGFVQSELSRPSDQITASLTAGGIARPFVRVRKAQETNFAYNQNPALNLPIVTATMPFQTQVRLDTRTPNTSIRYSNSTGGVTNITAVDNNWFITTLAANNPAAPAAPAYNGTAYANGAEITIGTNNEYQGYVWKVNARAFAGTNPVAGSASSISSEDIAFRTVFTYQITANMSAAAGEQRLATGDQVWIRGGDAIMSSSIPGYPLTWEDDWSLLASEGRRAGIRLMTQTTTATEGGTGTGNIGSATWKWVSWEITVPTYFDIIMGRQTTAEPPAVLQQYGPRQWAYQRAGWTSFKDRYTLLPGNHRWVTTQNNLGGMNTAGATEKGAVNFSGTFNVRPSYPSASWVP